MANKRQLTGGTDDVNPQYLSAAVTQTGTDAFTQLTLGTPIVRVGTDSSGSATIMEVLKVYFDLPIPDTTAAAATLRSAIMCITTSSGTGTTITPFSDPKVLAQFRRDNVNAFTAGGTGVLQMEHGPHVMDLTDGAGHGVLVAVDNLFLECNTSGMSEAKTFRVKILYRFKKVKLVEYIGIVQSQQ